MSPMATPKLQPVRHLRAVQPLHFPEQELVPEGLTHFYLRTFLFRLLQSALGDPHSVGCDQFVYWNAATARASLSPDVFVKLGVPQRSFGSWKTWEHGAPDLAVEIISPNEGDGIDWQEKLARYHQCGVVELVRFDPEGEPGRRLRAWDRIDGDLVERLVEGDSTQCLTLGLVWVVCPVESEPVGLRLAYASGTLVASELETSNAARDREAAARAAAEARIVELEAELARSRK
jgi:Uma2 family endonuclease